MRFSEMLDRKAEEIQRPPLLPVGIYRVQWTQPAEQDSIDSSKTGKTYDRLTFVGQVVEAVEVDENELAEFGNVQGTRVRHNYLFSTAEEDANATELRLTFLKEFLMDLGAFEDGMTLSEGLGNAVGTTCLVEIGHRIDGDSTYVDIKRTFAE